MRKVLIGLLVLAVFAGAAWTVHFMTAQKKFVSACLVCHEMREHRENLKFASHNGIDCRKCHVQDPVYKMAYRKAFDGRNKFKNIKVSNERCAGCHPKIEETTVFYHDVKFSHQKHLEADQGCSTCHRSFVHRESEKSPLISLRQCRECHEVKRHVPGRGGPREIPDTGELEKQPHEPNWYVRHKRISTVEKAGCAKCHHEDYCSNCHTNFKSHIKDWWANHYQEAMIRLSECQICHRPEYCVSCHKGEIPADHDKKWGMAHWENVDLKQCNECHTLNFCQSCHTRKQPSSHATIKDHAGMTPDREPLCNVCHDDNSCSTCHHKPGETGKCLNCHSSVLKKTKKVSGRTFSHNTHAIVENVECEKCHSPSWHTGMVDTRSDCSACHHGLSEKSCRNCHRDALKQPIYVQKKKFGHEAHVKGGLGCSKCHGEYPFRATKMKPADCDSCHHGKGAPACEKCHAAAAKEMKSGSKDMECDACHERTARGFADPAGNCASCHSEQAEENAGVHGADTCMNCHRAHKWKVGAQRPVCGECHEDQINNHGMDDIDECSACHTPHRWAM